MNSAYTQEQTRSTNSEQHMRTSSSVDNETGGAMKPMANHGHGHMMSPDDPDNPQNWPLYRKLYVSVVSFAFGFAVLVTLSALLRNSIHSNSAKCIWPYLLHCWHHCSDQAVRCINDHLDPRHIPIHIWDHFRAYHYATS